MKKKVWPAMALLPMSLATAVASAQEEQSDDMHILPVETYACDYKDGKGRKDLDKAIATWNAWMDSKAVDSYGAMVLEPYYFGPETFDVAWLGFWTSGDAMGAATDLYLKEGGATAEAFAAVVSCDSHSNFASAGIKAPPAGDPPDSMVLQFSDCNIREGTEWGALMKGYADWAAYQEAEQYGNGLWMLFPAFGGGDAEYDFKEVTSYGDHTAAGKAYEKYANGGGWEKHQETVAHMLRCDDSRVYNVTFVRKLPPQPGD